MKTYTDNGQTIQSPDGKFIPKDERNIDYQQYLKEASEGKAEAIPAPVITAEPKAAKQFLGELLDLLQEMEANGVTVEDLKALNRE